jgi:adenylyl-sulfate kinase
MTDLPAAESGRRAGMTIWLTGLPAAGKTTLGDAVAAALASAGLLVSRLDGDVLREGLCSDLGFSLADRAENNRRAGHVAALIAETGAIVIASFISPYAADRQRIRDLHKARGIGFVEVFVDTPVQECRRRDPRGLYARADRHEVEHVTGVDDPYERPTEPELHVHPGPESVADCVSKVAATVLSPTQR